uniref:Uncharacterized protein n=1 Tax=Arundo donax TaxID=35708 RepID=A0A0A9BSP4_ARUDO
MEESKLNLTSHYL